MGTEKYEEKQEFIAKAAFQLFREKGFAKTSVKDIADAAGIKKALVRYYFPKKDAFEDLLLNRSLDLADEFLDELNLEDLDTLERLTFLGYFELYYVCKHKTMLKLGRDIMESRELTRSIQKTIVSWAIANHEISDEKKQSFSDGVLYAIGAAFEFIYFHMMEEQPFNIDEVFNVAATILKNVTEYPLSIPDVSKYMSEDWLKEKSRKMDKAIFGI